MSYSIHFNLVLSGVAAPGSKQALKAIAREIAPQIYYSADKLLGALIEQEEKSPSGIGDGLAIPHLKLPELRDRFVCLATLDRPVDFGASDDKAADIICVLLSPENHGPLHLRGLSRITRLLQNEQLQRRLRETDDIDTMRAFLANPEGWLLAA